MIKELPFPLAVVSFIPPEGWASRTSDVKMVPLLVPIYAQSEPNISASTQENIQILSTG